MYAFRQLRSVLWVALLGLPIAGLADTRWVSFPAATTVDVAPQRTAAASTPTRASERDVLLRGQLFVPEGEPPFPAVVLLHDCRGVRPYQREWARMLTGWGYVALLFDSFLSRHAAGVCAKLADWEDIRVGDAYGALVYLAALPIVDKDRVAIMGWGHSAVLDAVRQELRPVTVPHSFKAAVALAPACTANGKRWFAAPVLMLAAARDAWTPVRPCERLARDAAGNAITIELKVYADAEHGFDDPDVGEGVYLRAADRANASLGREVVLRYNRAAHEDAVNNVQAFLMRYLGPTKTHHTALAAGTYDTASTWVVDPKDIGANVPPSGRSLFDVLFTRPEGDRRVYDVPFPFTRVLERIEAHLSQDYAGSSGLKKLLIPLGRSLQRTAAAPEFFRYPRVIVAVDTEPAATAADRSVMWLKDRLFMGYQEKSGIIEVISYNESAGRFEFQVIKDYAPGRPPDVRYANRAICTSCHQNAGPIFPSAAWDETNGNHRVAVHLAKEQPVLYGIPANLSRVVPAAVDNATDRANLFAAYQLLWREGCSDGQSPAAAIRCRAAAVTAMLQHRLGAFSYFDQQAALEWNYFVPLSARNWRRRWPRGLAIADPDIPNREPLLSPTPWAVPSELDPLNMRAPLATWQLARDRDRVILGLGEFMPASDLRRLDRYLFETAKRLNAHRQHFTGPCEFTRQGSLTAEKRVAVRCRFGNGNNPQLFELTADLAIMGQQLTERTIINALDVRNGPRFTGFAQKGGALRLADDQWVAALDVSRTLEGFHVRLPSGNAVETIELRWPKLLGTDTLGFMGAATLTVIHDFAPVQDAITRLIASADEDKIDIFADAPFRGTTTMQALFTELGLQPTAWCCETFARMPAVRVDDGADPVELKASAQSAKALFYRYCATCHQTQALLPPGFLFGDLNQVEANLAQCAERIYYRLNMWQLNEADRAKSPMPPVTHVRALNYTAGNWRTSSELAELRRYAGALLRDARTTPEDFVVRDYEKLRPCLPGRS